MAFPSNIQTKINYIPFQPVLNDDNLDIPKYYDLLYFFKEEPFNQYNKYVKEISQYIMMKDIEEFKLMMMRLFYFRIIPLDIYNYEYNYIFKTDDDQMLCNDKFFMTIHKQLKCEISYKWTMSSELSRIININSNSNIPENQIVYVTEESEPIDMITKLKHTSSPYTEETDI